MEKDAVLYKFTTQLPARFVVDEGKWQLHGLFAEIDEATGKATRLEKIRLREDEWVMD
ncbi:hypothetical protein D3C81_2261000 [compost metagenome]